MSDIPEASQNSAPKSNSKNLIIIVVVLAVLGIGWFVFNFVSNKASTMLGEKAAENMIEKATGGQADVDISGDKMTIKTDEGTFSTSAELPKEWPADAPIYPDADVTYSGSSTQTEGASGFSVMLASKDAVKQISDYYTQELPDQGWVVDSTQTMTGLTIIGASKNNRNMSVSITTSDDGISAITLVVTNEN